MHTSEWVLLNYLTGDQFLGQAWYVPNVTLHTTHNEFFCLKFEKKKRKGWLVHAMQSNGPLHQVFLVHYGIVQSVLWIYKVSPWFINSISDLSKYSQFTTVQFKMYHGYLKSICGLLIVFLVCSLHSPRFRSHRLSALHLCLHFPNDSYVHLFYEISTLNSINPPVLLELDINHYPSPL